MEKLSFCECGCGGVVGKFGNKFIRGHNGKKKRETRICAASGCNITFEVIITSKKHYCCSGHANKKSWETCVRACACKCGETFVCKINSKQKFIQWHSSRINNGMKGKHPPNWIPRELRICVYVECDTVFECKVNSTQRYCSVSCVGKDPTVGCIWTEERREHLRKINMGGSGIPKKQKKR